MTGRAEKRKTNPEDPTTSKRVQLEMIIQNEKVQLTPKDLAEFRAKYPNQYQQWDFLDKTIYADLIKAQKLANDVDYEQAKTKYRECLINLLLLQSILSEKPFNSPKNLAIVGGLINIVAGRKNSLEMLAGLDNKNSLATKLTLSTANILKTIESDYINTLKAMDDALDKIDKQELGDFDNLAKPTKKPTFLGPNASKIIQKLGAIVIESEEIKIHLDDIYGNSKLKEQFKSFQRTTIGVSPILLFGPPGSGKNTIINALAHYLNKGVVIIPVSSILGSFQGESEKNIKSALDLVSLVYDRAIVVLDEIETLASDRSQASNLASRDTIVQTFLSLLDDLKLNQREALKSLMFTTNYLGKLDNAFKRRVQPILVDYPTREEVVSIFFEILTQYNIYDLNIYNQLDFQQYLTTPVGRFAPSTLVSVVEVAFSKATSNRVTCNTNGYNARLSEPVENVCIYSDTGNLDIKEVPPGPIYPPAISVYKVLEILKDTRPTISETAYLEYIGQ